jgi:hypothetical protein
LGEKLQIKEVRLYDLLLFPLHGGGETGLCPALQNKWLLDREKFHGNFLDMVWFNPKSRSPRQIRVGARFLSGFRFYLGAAKYCLLG